MNESLTNNKPRKVDWLHIIVTPDNGKSLEVGVAVFEGELRETKLTRAIEILTLDYGNIKYDLLPE